VTNVHVTSTSQRGGVLKKKKKLAEKGFKTNHILAQSVFLLKESVRDRGFEGASRPHRAIQRKNEMRGEEAF